MSENIRMDAHKLIYHPEAVARWLQGEQIYPIEIEISPSGACNHRCIFCAVDYIGYQPVYLKKDMLLPQLRRMHEKGLKSVICSGEGEPFLNPDMSELACGIRACGVDVALSTNGVLFTKEKLEACLHAFSWVRYSVASLEEHTYRMIQRGREGDLDKLRQNLIDAVAVKRRKGLETTLGVQCLLLEQNAHLLGSMAKELREIGVDYFTVKPYSQHPHSKNTLAVDYQKLLELEKEVRSYETEHFSVYFRQGAMKKLHHEKQYDRCYGLPFMTHIDASGNVWPCIAHIGSQEYLYGNLYEQTFEEIWEGDRRRRVNDRICSAGLQKICREACRLDEINRYLYELRHPGKHVNFI